MFKACNRRKKCLFLVGILLICLLITKNTHAANFEDVIVTKKILIDSAWGSKQGEFGKWPDTEDGIASASANPIAVDNRGNIFVADSLNHRVQKFNKHGRYVSGFKLNADGGVPVIEDIAIDKYGNV